MRTAEIYTRRLLCLFQSLFNLLLLYLMKYRKNCIYYVIRRGGDLGGDREDRPPEIIRWRGRRCFYPPQYLGMS